MDAKTLAAQLRAAIRAATKTEGDALHGLKISVRTERASLMTEIAVTVTGLPESALIVPENDREPGQGWATDRAHAISDRIHELGAAAYDWADGQMRFFGVSFDGLSAPLPRVQITPEDQPEPAGPVCSKGHGPMTRQDPAHMSASANQVGTWWECEHQEPGITCRNSYVEPNPRFREFLAEQEQRATTATTEPTVRTRRGHLATVC